MQVFKTCLKIIHKNLPILILYVAITIMISLIYILANQPVSTEDYVQRGCRITIFNHDEDGKLSGALKEYLLSINQEVIINEDEQALQDALFFRNTAYVLTIPEGFSRSFLEGEETELFKTAVPDSTEQYYVDMQIEQFLSAGRLYAQSGMGEQELCSALSEDVKSQVQVYMLSSDSGERAQPNHVYYFNYLCYAMLSVLILGVSAIMLGFQKKDVRRRNLCAPISSSRMSFEIALATGIFAAACYLILLLCAFALYRMELIQSIGFPLFCLNFFIFTLVSLGIAFLCTLFIKSANVQAAIANIVTLSMCFLCGVFVPQYLMSPSVLNVSRFLPAYWYIQANESIGTLTSLSLETLRPILGYMGIELAFAVAIFTVALLISKKSRVTQS